MKKLLLLEVSLLFTSLVCIAQNQITLPNGWKLSPAGRSIPLGDLPLNMAVSKSKKLLAVTNNGQSTQSLQLINVASEKIIATTVIARSWVGLAFSSDEKYLYASGGNDNKILQYRIANNQLLLTDSIILGNPWPNKISPAGIAIDDEQRILYVVTKDNNSLYVTDLVTKKVKGIYKLNGEAYTCVLSPDKKTLYISCWGCDKVLLFDTRQQKIDGEIAVGDNPNELCLDKKGSFLFVTNANDNSVSVINTRQRKVVETLTASLYPDAPPGSTSNGLALSPDGKILYIANADNNCLSVFDVSRPGFSKAKGFIPTGWYPTCVKQIGNKIFVTNGKGMSSKANPRGPSPINKKQKINYQKGDTSRAAEVQYIGGLFKGTMSIIDLPTEAQLGNYAKQVYANTPYSKSKELLSEGADNNPIPKKIGSPSPIKHVFYIIKENRTYDQVLADVYGGNGDTSLLLFGENITPNQHKLVKDFVLLDNFYVDGEVSADGHNWTLGAYATDYLEKNWVTSYGGRGGGYDAEGTREIANNKGGFLWDHCKKAGVSFRTYGEFADDYKPNIPVLKNHFCTYYTSWDQSVKDTTRVRQWKKDFDSLVSINALPQLNTLRLINDHTEGLRKGRPTPFAHVADNDLGVGMFIEMLSLSPVWKESVVFIVEDDAQDGPDHVDAHRSTAYIAGPYVKRGFIDHSSYTTSGLLRTIELILGIPPMSQYDAAAVPLWKCFTPTPDFATFTAMPAKVDLTQKTIVKNELTEQSELFDFTKEDRVPDRIFSEVLWRAVKGLNTVMPVPKRAAFVQVRD
ncbi:MAG: bifunctional YncE family protein/alkaline phosphatase family protein [Ferruginibacter sp.]